VWAYRELLFYLTWRDTKVRYKQTMLGVTWVLLQPLMMTIVFTLVLGRLARVDSGGIPYPLFVYAALLPWNFFSSAVSSGGGSLIANQHLITKVFFPRLIVPGSAVAARLFDFAVAFLLLLGMMVFYRVAPTWNILMVPVLVALLTLLALGCSLWFAALNVRFRDVAVAVPVLLQVWMFVSPIVYSARLVPAEWRALYALNPLVGIVENFRAAIYGGPFDWPSLAISGAVTLVVLPLAARTFRRLERSFADFI